MANPFKDRWDKLEPDEIRAGQGALLQRYLRDCVVPFSPYYKSVFEERGLEPDSIDSLEKLREIPFATKQDLQPTPDNPMRARDFVVVPDRRILMKRMSVVLRAAVVGRAKVKAHFEHMYRPIFMTSTTGRSAEPTSFLYTGHDIDLLRVAGKRINQIAGMRKDERLLNMFPFAPHLAFWLTHYSATASGVFSLSSGGGKVMGTDGNIRMLEKLKPDVLTGMPTFVYHVLQQAIDEGVRVESLKRVILGGEKVPEGSRARLRAMAEELGSPGIDVLVTFGFTEAKMAWTESPAPPGEPSSGYLTYPDLGIFEIVDPDTGEAVGEGEPGEIVYTPLNSRGTVVLRYRTGDCIDGGLIYEPCPYTGRKVPRLVGKISRKSNFMEMSIQKIKGTLIDFNEVEYALDDAPMIDTWQLEIRKRKDDPLQLDELILHAVRADNEKDEATLIAELNERFAAFTETRLNRVIFHNTEEMRGLHGVGQEMKERKIVDYRPRDGEPAPPRNF